MHSKFWHRWGSFCHPTIMTDSPKTGHCSVCGRRFIIGYLPYYFLFFIPTGLKTPDRGWVEVKETRLKSS